MRKILAYWPIWLFLFLTIFLFRQYVFLGKVPFAGNLLVSFYEPWKSYSWGGYGSNGPSNKPIGFDSLRIFYPLRSLTVDSFKHVTLPLWNPYDFAGNTQLATYQSAVFFPLMPLFLLLPQIDAWSLIVFLAPFLTALFTYLFLRKLPLSKKSSSIGALSFGFSAGILVLVEESFMSVYSLMFLPLMLLGIYSFFRERKFRWFALFIIGGVFSIFSGWFQSTLYVFLLSFSWVIFLSFQQKQLKRGAMLMGGFGLIVLLAGPHLIPNIESYIYSARGTTDARFLFDMYLLKPWELITAIAPDFFGNPGTYSYFGRGFFYERVLSIGIGGLILGLVALLRNKKSSTEWFFSISWVVTMLLGISLPTTWFILYTLHIPIISTILPSRIFLLSTFCLSTLAAYGMESFLKNPPKKSFIVASAILFLILGGAWAFVVYQKIHHPWNEYATISLKNLFLPSILVGVAVVGGMLLLCKQKSKKYSGFVVLLLVALVGSIYFANKYLYFSERQFTFPASPVLSQLQKKAGNNRVWSYGEGYVIRNFSSQYHLQSPEGYDSFYIRTFGEFIEASKNGGKYTKQIPRADAQLVSVNTLSEIEKNLSLRKALNLLGVRYISAKENSVDETFVTEHPESGFKKVWSDSVYVIYENTSAFPRAFFVDSYQVINPKDQLSLLFSNATDLSKTLLLQEDPKIKQTNSNLISSTLIKEYRPESIAISVQTNKTALLFLSDNNYPGWKAYIDGKETHIFTADHAFRSVIVPRGSHTILFTYQPLSVLLGFVSFLVGLLLFVIFGFTIKGSFR